MTRIHFLGVAEICWLSLKATSSSGPTTRLQFSSFSELEKCGQVRILDNGKWLEAMNSNSFLVQKELPTHILLSFSFCDSLGTPCQT
jgi:hypothetical protein